MENKKLDYFLLLKSVILFAVFSVAAVFIFALALYFLEGGYEYSPLLATISLAVGCFATAFYLGWKLGKNGILIGLAVGGTVFIIASLITLFVNSGAVSVHILLRLVILLLSALIGGILGVNRKDNEKYI